MLFLPSLHISFFNFQKKISIRKNAPSTLMHLNESVLLINGLSEFIMYIISIVEEVCYSNEVKVMHYECKYEMLI